MDDTEIKYFVEAALLAAGRPLSVDQLHALFDSGSVPEKSEIRRALLELNREFERRGIAIVEVASGFRVQIKPGMVERLQKLWEERPPRYSRALFETLALIAYRQPITRGEIEEIRGVAVSSNIIRSMLERDWIRVVGHRDVPGRPAMFGTTRGFLDYFGLKKLDDLPPLADLSDWESLRVQLNLPEVSPDDGSDEMGDVTAFPVLYPEVTADSEIESDLPDIEMVLSDNSDESDRAFTRIAAKPWPAPKESAIDDPDDVDDDVDDEIEAKPGADASVSRS